MSASYNSIVITTAGQALLARVQANLTGMTITRVAAGSGTYSDKSTAALEALTALKSQQQSFAMASSSVYSTTQLKARVLFNNDSLASGYYMNELGIFAEDDSHNEVLYGIAVCTGSEGDYMPPESYGAVNIWRSFYIAVANASTVGVTLSSDFMVDDTEGLCGGQGATINMQQLVDEIADRVVRELAASLVADSGLKLKASDNTVLSTLTAATIRDALGLGNTSGALPVANGGTGKNTHTGNAVLTGDGTNAVKNVATANGAMYATQANGAPQFGTLPVGQGGTGMVASPSMLTNLGSTAAADVLAASPRPGVTGTLPIGNGGTGQTTAAGVRNALGLGNTTGALPIANGGTGQTTAAAARNALGLGNTTGALPVANGGTGATTVSGIFTALGISFIPFSDVTLANLSASMLSTTMPATGVPLGSICLLGITSSNAGTCYSTYNLRAYVPSANSIQIYGYDVNASSPTVKISGYVMVIKKP